MKKQNNPKKENGLYASKKIVTGAVIVLGALLFLVGTFAVLDVTNVIDVKHIFSDEKNEAKDEVKDEVKDKTKDSSNKKQKQIKIEEDEGIVIDETISEEDIEKNSLDLKDTKEIKAEIQRRTDASYMKYKINVNPVFKDVNSKGNIMIENAKENPYLMQVEIIVNKDENSIYKSPVMEPGTSIANANLTKKNLKKGQYPAIAYFRCYDKETKKMKGEAGMKITVTIQN